MHRYAKLHPRVGYLGNVQAALSGANGITLRDIEAAEVLAAREIERALPAWLAASWASAPPGLIERIAEMLAAAHLLCLRRRRCGLTDGEPRALPGVLRSEGRLLLSRLRRGEIELRYAAGRLCAAPEKHGCGRRRRLETNRELE